MRKNSIFKGLALSAFFACTLFAGLINVEAYQGNWTSSKSTDYNGLSEVWTTYTGGGNESETVGLYVKYSRDGSNVGYKTVGCTEDQQVSHYCWGDLNRDKYGYVKIGSDCYHNPGFGA